MGIVNAHEQLSRGIRQGKFLGGIMDKIVPNEITSFMNSAADKLMPKEIAPYASFLAPLLVPIIGPAGAHAFAQLGSAKQNDGQLDPLAALAVHGASSTQTARDIRNSYDASKAWNAADQGGTWGQRVSGAIGDWLGGGDLAGGTAANSGNWLSRAFQPTQSMFEGTSAFGTDWFNNTLGMGVDDSTRSILDKSNPAWKYMERPGDALNLLAEANNPALYATDAAGAIRELIPNTNFDPTLKGPAMEQQLRDGVSAVEAKPDPRKLTQEGEDLFAEYNANVTEANKLDPKNLADREYLFKQVNEEDALKMFETTPGFEALEGNITTMQNVTEGVVDYVAPGLDDLQQTLGMGDAKLLANFKDLDVIEQIKTVGALAASGSYQTAEKAIREEKFKNKQERDAVLRAYFDSYERSGRKYNDSRYLKYKDPEMVALYEEIYGYKYGGRVNKNMGGIMEVAPGVPQGMELDYRNSGGFIPMGGPELADDVPAMLSRNEFVLTADAMKGLDKAMGGQGDPRASAKHMYQMMQQLEAMA